MKKMIGTLALGLAIAGSLGATGVTTAEPAESNNQARLDCVTQTLIFMDMIGYYYSLSDREVSWWGNQYYADCSGW